MTYHGGVQDGKIYMAVKILRVIRSPVLTDTEKLNDITTICTFAIDKPTKPKFYAEEEEEEDEGN